MDEDYEIRGVFFDISKAFDKVWHEGLVFKLKQNGISGNLLNIFEDFLRNRKQRVVLNGQTSNWENIHAGVPQGSILGPLLFLIYINDLAENLSSNPKLFADDTSLFSVVRDLNTSAIEINDDLKKIEAWAHQWKMSFNPDPLKQAQEVIFSRKRNKPHHPDIIFNGNPVKKSSYQKHLGMFLDSKLDFDEHIKGVFEKTSKSIGLIRKLRNFLPRPSLLQIYKSFVRPHLDYGDIIYDKAFIGYFQKKLESIQYNAALAITGAIRGTSREKIYSELGLESLQDRRWYRKLCVFYKILNNMSPKYLSDIIPSTTRRYSSRNANNIPLVRANTNYFMNTFFPSTITEWNKLDLSIRKSTSLNIFKSRLLRFVRPLENSVFTCHNPIGIKYLTSIRLGFSHLRYHKFKHGFLDAFDPLCSCSTAIENTSFTVPTFQLLEIPFSMK